MLNLNQVVLHSYGHLHLRSHFRFIYRYLRMLWPFVRFTTNKIVGRLCQRIIRNIENKSNVCFASFAPFLLFSSKKLWKKFWLMMHQASVRNCNPFLDTKKAKKAKKALSMSRRPPKAHFQSNFFDFILIALGRSTFLWKKLPTP